MSWLDLAIGIAVGGAAVWAVEELLLARRRRRPSPHAHEIESSASAPPPPPSIIATPPTERPMTEGADLAGRVLVHLASLGRLGPHEVAPEGFTQRGMSERLGIRQGSLTKVVTRLVAAGALEVDRRHVEGASQRLKVYRLTPLGEAVARDVRRRRGPGGAPPIAGLGGSPMASLPPPRPRTPPLVGRLAEPAPLMTRPPRP